MAPDSRTDIWTRQKQQRGSGETAVKQQKPMKQKSYENRCFSMAKPARRPPELAGKQHRHSRKAAEKQHNNRKAKNRKSCEATLQHCFGLAKPSHCPLLSVVSNYFALPVPQLIRFLLWARKPYVFTAKVTQNGPIKCSFSCGRQGTPE